jgi:hypothetical protein
MTTIPFMGFYDTLHDSQYEDAINIMFSDHDTGYNFDPHGLDPWNYSDSSYFMEEYSKAYVEEFASEFNLKLTFDDLSSPREYNFTTDRIFAEIADSDIKRVLDGFNRDNFAKFVRSKFTSYDGFISYYNPDLNEWGSDLDEWDHNQIGTILDFMVSEEWGNDQHMEEYSLMEDYSCNGYIHDWVLHENEGLTRLVNIHDYLEGRKQRTPFTWSDHRRNQRAKNLTFLDAPLGKGVPA